METNWIALIVVLACAIALIVFLILRNQKDKEEVIKSFNAENNIENDLETEKDME